METISKTRKIGGSLVITIPRVIVEEQGLSENQAVKIKVKKLRKSGFGIFFTITNTPKAIGTAIITI